VRAGGLWLARRGRWRLARLKGEEAENQKPPKAGVSPDFLPQGREAAVRVKRKKKRKSAALAVVEGRRAGDGAGNGYGEESQGGKGGKVGAGFGGGSFGSPSSAKGRGQPGSAGRDSRELSGFGSPRGEGRRLAKKAEIF